METNKEKVYIVRESRLHTTAHDRQQFYATMLEVAPDQKELIYAIQDLGAALEKGLELTTSFLQTRQSEEALKTVNETLKNISERIVALSKGSEQPAEEKPAPKRKTSRSTK